MPVCSDGYRFGFEPGIRARPETARPNETCV